MTDTGISQRERATPKRIEPLKRTGESLSPPPDVGAEKPLAPPRDDAATRRATDAELQAHLEELGPGYVRQAFGSRKAKLSCPSRPGFQRHWANDSPGRVVEMQERGYKIVNDTDGKPIKRVVGVSAKGDGQVGILMEIPIQWHEENLAVSQRAADEIERAIRRNEIKGVDGTHTYIPRDGQRDDGSREALREVR